MEALTNPYSMVSCPGKLSYLGALCNSTILVNWFFYSLSGSFAILYGHMCLFWKTVHHNKGSYCFSIYGWSYKFIFARISLLILFCWRTHLSRSRRLSSKSSTITGLWPYKYYSRSAGTYLLVNHVIGKDNRGGGGTNTDSHHGNRENNLHRHGC